MAISPNRYHRLSEPEQLSYPQRLIGLWRVTCTCGYRTMSYFTPEEAKSYADDHYTTATAPPPPTTVSNRRRKGK